MEKQEQCKGCPWESPENCGACKRDRDREEWDRKQDAYSPKK